MNNCAKILIIYILRKCGDKKFTYLTHFNANEENYNKSEDDVYLEKIDISEFYSSEEQIKKGDSTNLKNEEEAEVRAMLADAEKLLKEAMASTHVEDDEEESDVEFLDID